MGLFQKKKTIQTHVDPKLVDALKTYIEQHQALVKEKNEKKPQDPESPASWFLSAFSLSSSYADISVYKMER